MLCKRDSVADKEKALDSLTAMVQQCNKQSLRVRVDSADELTMVTKIPSLDFASVS